MNFNSITVLWVPRVGVLASWIFAHKVSVSHLALELALPRHAKAGVSLKITLIDNSHLSRELLVNHCQEDLLRRWPSSLASLLCMRTSGICAQATLLDTLTPYTHVVCASHDCVSNAMVKTYVRHFCLHVFFLWRGWGGAWTGQIFFSFFFHLLLILTISIYEVSVHE